MSRFIELLPEVFKTDTVAKQLAEIEDSSLDNIRNEMNNLSVLNNIDNLNNEQLDALALSFHLLKNEGAFFADTIDKKRKLIKNLINFHKTKGTVESINKIISDLGIDASISEWFEYDLNSPYNFRIYLGLNEGFNESKIVALQSMVKEIMPVRCKLDGTILKLFSQGQIHISSTQHFTERFCIGGK